MSYATYGYLGVSGLVTGSLALYILLTGHGSLFDVGYFLESISPVYWATMGIALNIGMSVIGAGYGILITGSSIAGAAVRTPRVRTKNLISIIFCEVVGIYGVIGAIVFSSKLSGSSSIENQFSASNVFSGFALFWGGLTMGICNLLCGIAVGVSGANAVVADASDPSLFVKVLVVEVFSSILGLFGLIIALLASGKAAEFS